MNSAHVKYISQKHVSVIKVLRLTKAALHNIHYVSYGIWSHLTINLIKKSIPTILINHDCYYAIFVVVGQEIIERPWEYIIVLFICGYKKLPQKTHQATQKDKTERKSRHAMVLLISFFCHRLLCTKLTWEGLQRKMPVLLFFEIYATLNLHGWERFVHFCVEFHEKIRTMILSVGII